MKASAVLGLCLALAVRANPQFPFYEAGDDGEGIIWGGWGSGSGSGSNGGDSSGGYGSSAGSDSSGFDVYPDFDVEKAMNYGTAHGVIAALCFAILFPAGAILMRIIPGRHAWWIHGVFQVIAYLLYIAAAALGIRLIQIIKIPPNGTSLVSVPFIPTLPHLPFALGSRLLCYQCHPIQHPLHLKPNLACPQSPITLLTTLRKQLEMSSTNAHPIIGIVILAVLFLQPPLGIIHHAKFKRLGRRTASSHLHLWLGRLTLTLGIINGGLGLRLARASQGVIIAYAVVAGLVWLLWVLVAVLAEYRRRSASRGQNRGRGRGRGASGSGGSGGGGGSGSRRRGGGVETRAYVADLPPPPGLAQTAPSARETRRRNRDGEGGGYGYGSGGYDSTHGYNQYNQSQRRGGSSDDPSPPYTPGPFHGGPPGYTGGAEGVEMRPVKNSTRGSGSMSSFSSGAVPRDGEHRV
ncbi:uncharacterized protein F4807DRAFT_104065 [Annulohypoxylon truncatum]|uniref:uncharacterized protein n=1 Tax=Annulohypoxylon truncatum TaxID=327061 RepID=UPI00200778C7|nr:uncharacterized protein F4807DRAFT_104065 [Annulohypoxylon truncatum]KAI1208913.1 hypothetical protein F4807DRAFT_104065 [Annulohypoxylon truncatum]